MNPSQLLDHFDRISDAPDAIQCLRGFILDLAVRGKLVEQNPADEVASELLLRIHFEKTRLMAAGEMRGQADLPEIDDAEVPFEIPSSWQWVHLIDLLNKLTDGTHHSPVNLADGAFKYVTAKNIKPEGISLEEISYISVDVHREIYARCNPEKGDILYIKDGATTGVVTINDLDEPFSMLSSVALLKVSAGVFNRHLVEFLRSPFFYAQMRGFMKGAAIPRVTLKRMAPALIPLPPLAEQHRIVARVDELMALCNQLEATQAERERRRDRLTAASLQRLNTPADTSEFREHADFHLHHLARMTTRPDQIQALRQTILNLAVSGQLVQQDSKDEPASELVKRIHSERARFGKDSLKLQPLSLIAAEEIPSAVPNSWEWIRLGDLLLGDSQNGYSKRPDDAIDGIPIFRISAGTARKDGVVAEEEYKLIGGISAATQQQYELQPGDLLACRFNGNRTFVGRLSLYLGYLGIKPIYPDKLIRLRLLSQVALPQLVRCFSASSLIREDIETYCATTVGNWGISASNLKQVRVPLPPYAEQRRIVAKVEELMSVCDRLEAQLTATQTESRRLLEAVLHEALTGAATSRA